MTKQEHIDKIHASRDERGNATRATLDYAEAALRECPHAPDLWCLRGDMIQMAAGDDRYTLSDAAESYRRALEESPDFAEAHESLGYFLDAVDDNPAEAEPFFRKALDLDPTPGAFAGLARVLAEIGRKTEALDLLAPANCPSAEDQVVAETRREIEEGVWDG